MNRWWDIKPGDLKELRPSKQEHMANRAVASSMDDNLTLYSDGMTLGTVKNVYSGSWLRKERINWNDISHSKTTFPNHKAVKNGRRDARFCH